MTQSTSYNLAPDANRLDQVNRKFLSYDVRGNLLVDKNGKRSFDYDVTNRMTAFYKNEELKASYDYNVYGQRIRKTLHRNSGGEDSYKTLHFTYTPKGWLLSENAKSRSNTRTFARDYIWLGNRPLAQIERKIRQDGTTRKAKISYLHTDHLNTPRSASDETGASVWNWKSDAFGQGKANRDVDGDGNKTVIRLRFPGQYFDRESGLFYNHHRDYDPKLGRYIQSDPIGLNGGINRYVYVGNDPVNYTDSTGLLRTAQFRECTVTVIIDSEGNEIPGSAIRTCSGGSSGTGIVGGHGSSGIGNSGIGNGGSSGLGFNPASGGDVTQCAAVGGENCVPPETPPLEPDERPCASEFVDSYLEYQISRDNTPVGYTTPEVWQIVGGSLLQNHLNAPYYYNSCALRVSCGLNGSGYIIPSISRVSNRVWGGANNGLRFIISARNLRTHLNNNWGAPDSTFTTLRNLRNRISGGQAAIVVSNGHAAVVTHTYNDYSVGGFGGDVYILPECPSE